MWLQDCATVSLLCCMFCKIISLLSPFLSFSRHGQNTFPFSIRSCQIQTMVTTNTNHQTFHSVWKELTKKRTPSQTRTDTSYKRYSESSVGSCVEPELWSKDPKFEDYEKRKINVDISCLQMESCVWKSCCTFNQIWILF